MRTFRLALGTALLATAACGGARAPGETAPGEGPPAPLAQQPRRAAEQGFLGEWYGTSFGSAPTRLTIAREGSTLTAVFLNQGYREILRGEMLPGGRLLLTGVSVTRDDGGSADLYSLDVFELGLSGDASTLQGTARDERGSQGPVVMRRTRP